MIGEKGVGRNMVIWRMSTAWNEASANLHNVVSAVVAEQMVGGDVEFSSN